MEINKLHDAIQADNKGDKKLAKILLAGVIHDDP